MKINEIFIIDDGSDDDSVKRCKRKGLKVISNNKNMGRGYTRRRAMQLAKNDFVLSCDATLRLPNNFLTKALQFFRSENSLAAVYGLITQKNAITSADRWREVHLFKSNINHKVIRQFGFISGGSLVNKKAVLSVDNYDENMKHGEDGDLGLRLIKKGYTTIFDPGLRLNSNKSDTFISVLERYWRWNHSSSKRIDFKNYLKNIMYSWKVMIKDDFKRKDIDCLTISFCCPHYQFLKTVHSILQQKYCG